jgi:hypothetical protein
MMNPTTMTMTSIGMNANIIYIDTMTTSYREEQATSRSNLKIVYVGKSIITSCQNVVKNFILSLVVVTLLTFVMSLI